MRYYLTGFMGSGKSYVGKRVAERLGYDFIDLDEYIEQSAGITISEIFQFKGESYFRQLEKDCLKAASKKENVIIATGGGTPCFFDNMAFINKNGVCLYIRVNPLVLVQRLRNETAQRPLIAHKNDKELLQFIQQKLAERSPYYEQADIIYEIQTGNEDIVNEVIAVFLRF